MKYKIVTLAALACLALPGAAQANWKYSRWGMSVDQVIAASPGTVHRIADIEKDRVDELQRLAVGEVTEGGTKFQVQFYFSPGGTNLQLVRYEPAEKMTCTDEGVVIAKLLGNGKVTDTVESTDLGDGKKVDITYRTATWTGTQGDEVQFMEARAFDQSLDVCTFTFQRAGGRG